MGIDGMDPRLCEGMMKEGQLPNLTKLRAAGGFSALGTSIPPQSPVAWANFINGAGPGSHGIFDFIHRHPHEQCKPFYSAAETLPGVGGWDVGEHKVQLDFWPFSHKPPSTVLKRQGVPFWDYLDAAGVPTTFYDLPSNYPPSPSKHGHHRCLCGMGTPDMLGSYGTYQHFADNGPDEPLDEGGGKRFRLAFENETAKAHLVGPENSLLITPRPVTVEFLVHRDRRADAAVIELQGKRILLRAGQWSSWTKVDFGLSTPALVPTKHVSGIVRFYLQEVAPNFRLYVTPVNIDQSGPAVKMSETVASFVQDLSGRLGLFYTAGFQEDHKACSNGVFNDDEFASAGGHCPSRSGWALFEDAVENYDDGLLFFYFSSSDLQSHIFWWTSTPATRSGPTPRPRSTSATSAGCTKARRSDRRHLRPLRQPGDPLRDERPRLLELRPAVQPELLATRDAGYLGLPECTSIMKDADWSKTAWPTAWGSTGCTST
ncbi:MAG: alkaline phosphatase family protein [Gemmataceae bacterium]